MRKSVAFEQAVIKWTKTTGRRVANPDLKLDKFGSLDDVTECQNKCLMNPLCRSIDFYERGWKSCDLNNVTKEEAIKGDYLQPKTEVDFYEFQVLCGPGLEPDEKRCVQCPNDT